MVSEQPARRSTARLAARLIARLVQRTVQNKALMFLAVVLGVIWLINPTGLFGSGGGVDSPTTDSAELYLRALRDRNVNDFFSALAPQARQALQARFESSDPRAAAAAFFREQENQGMRVVSWERIGSYSTIQGDEFRFYVVRYQRGNERRDVSYVLTLDAQGKVARIE